MRYSAKLLAALTLVAGTGMAQAQDKPAMAFVVNAASDFWKLAEAGVNAAQAEMPDYDMQFRYPAQGTAAAQNLPGRRRGVRRAGAATVPSTPAQGPRA